MNMYGKIEKFYGNKSEEKLLDPKSKSMLMRRLQYRGSQEPYSFNSSKASLSQTNPVVAGNVLQ